MKPMADKADTTELTTNDGNESLFSGLPSDVVDNLTPAKTRMIMMYLTGQYSQKKIGQIIGVSETTIRTWLLDPIVQIAIKDIQQKEFAVIDSQLKAMRYAALDTMQGLLNSVMDNVRFQAAKDILDRGGHRPSQNIKVDKTITTLEQQLQSLADFTIDDAEIVDIDDYVEVVKNGG